jgi:serine/threonine protein phosphatase PrpC
LAGAADRLKAAVKGEFLKCEKALIRALDGVSGLEFDGSTATLVLRVEDRLICAWLGDSRALVGNRYTHTPLYTLGILRHAALHVSSYAYASSSYASTYDYVCRHVVMW